MARKPRATKPMEERSSITDSPAVRRVPVADTRSLIVLENTQGNHHYSAEALVGAIVWVRESDDQTFEAFRQAALDGGAVMVKRLPNAATDQPLALEPDAAAPLPESDVSEVRPVVTEMLSELKPEMRQPVTDYVEGLLASHGL